MDDEDKLLQYIDNFLENDYVQLKQHLELLTLKYKKKSKRLDKILSISDRQQLQLLTLNKELNSYKNFLEDKVEEEIKKRKAQEKILIHQSKLAAMGEMMDAVAHQWKQPLNIMSMYVDTMQYDFKDGLIDERYIKEFNKNFSTQMEHIINTLDEFRTFFRPNKKTENFSIRKAIDKVLLLVHDELIKNRITVNVAINDDITINGIENEFKHLILNIINNARDAFIENEIKDRTIDFALKQIEPFFFLEIQDNAGGIPETIIDDIFKPNVTTKAEGKGTGIGLYMSNQIAQKLNGQLLAENKDNGALLTFKFNKNQ